MASPQGWYRTGQKVTSQHPAVMSHQAGGQCADWFFSHHIQKFKLTMLESWVLQTTSTGLSGSIMVGPHVHGLPWFEDATEILARVRQ